MKKKWAIKQGMVFKGVYPRLMQGLCLGLGGERERRERRERGEKGERREGREERRERREKEK